MQTGKNRHPDFQRFYEDFIRIRGTANGPILYLQFLDHYKLDETTSYEVTAQKRLKEMALKSHKHQSIKKDYPMFGEGYWDYFITGIRKLIGKRVKLRTDHPLKIRVKNIRGRRLKVKLGEGIPVSRRSPDRPVRIRLDNPVRLNFRNLGGRRLNIRLGGGEC